MIHEIRDSISHGPVHQTRRKNCIQGNPRRGQYQSKSIHARINQGHFPNRKFFLQNLWFRGLHLQTVPNLQAVQPLKYDIPKRQAHSYTSSYPLCRPNLSTEVPSANAVIGTSAITRHNASRRLRIFFFIFIFIPPK